MIMLMNGAHSNRISVLECWSASVCVCVLHGMEPPRLTDESKMEKKTESYSFWFFICWTALTMGACALLTYHFLMQIDGFLFKWILKLVSFHPWTHHRPCAHFHTSISFVPNLLQNTHVLRIIRGTHNRFDGAVPSRQGGFCAEDGKPRTNGNCH